MAARTDFIKRHFMPGTPEEWLLAAGSLAATLAAAAGLYAMRKIFSAGDILGLYAVQNYTLALARAAYILMGLAAAAACCLSVRRLRIEGPSLKVLSLLACSLLLWLMPAAQNMVLHTGFKKSMQLLLASRQEIAQHRVAAALADRHMNAELRQRVIAIPAREHFITTGERIEVRDPLDGNRLFEPSPADRELRASIAGLTSDLEQLKTAGIVWLCCTPLWLVAGALLPARKKDSHRSEPA